MMSEPSNRLSGALERLWPLGLLVAGFAPVFSLLLWFLSDALDAAAVMRPYLSDREGGPETLFMLAAGALGWSSVALAEFRLGTTGTVLLWITVPTCLVSITAGFGLAVMLLGPLTDPQWEMLVVSAVTVIAASLVRQYCVGE